MKEIFLPLMGTLAGAAIAFLTNRLAARNQQKFSLTLEIRKSLIELHSKISKTHSQMLKLDKEFTDNKTYNERLSEMYILYTDAREYYKDYLLHFGHLFAYEINSSIASYGNELVLSGETLDKGQYKTFYTASKDTCGLMLGELRFKLLVLNNLNKTTREDRKVRRDEYVKYAIRINESIEGQLSQDLLNDSNDYPHLKEFKNRILPFENELKNRQKRCYK